jgi:hypothetical protein
MGSCWLSEKVHIKHSSIAKYGDTKGYEISVNTFDSEGFQLAKIGKEFVEGKKKSTSRLERGFQQNNLLVSFWEFLLWTLLSDSDDNTVRCEVLEQ